MISFNYDPFFGLVDWSIEEPERTPLNVKDKMEYLNSMVKINSKRKDRLYKRKIFNKKLKKESTLEWLKNIKKKREDE